MDECSTELNECKPLKNLQEVFRWIPDAKDWSKWIIGLVPRGIYCYHGTDFKCHKKFRRPLKILNSGAPKTLLCHDMKGGFLDDKFLSGVPYKYQYLFYHWSVIDIFVYFSHHFVTIPPLMWINAAHKHGVKILGTLITENEDGKQLCNEILQDEVTLYSFAEKLFDICKHYGFDGYLLNIENRIDEILLPNLLKFIKRLKTRIETLGGIIIWYDSVSLVNGKLMWQNELNENNRIAFDLCDGIFLNYTWNEHNLQRSVVNAGCRQCDVYVGIDVFGRGCFGGGGFNTDIAVRISRSFAFSVALFGAGWTHETQASDDNFFYIERMFWNKLWPYLFVHVYKSIPFETTFNRGIRICTDESTCYVDGKTGNIQQKSPTEKYICLYNLSSQTCQLSIPSCSGVVSHDDSCITYSSCFSEESYIILNGSAYEIEEHRLLLSDFACSQKYPLRFTVTVKSPFVTFIIRLTVENENQHFVVILEVSENMFTGEIDIFKNSETSKKVFDSDYSCNIDISHQANATKLISRSEDKKWLSNTYVINFQGSITEISALVTNTILMKSLSITYAIS